MLSVQRRGIGVILTWSFIVVSVLYVVYTVGRSVLIVDGGYSEWSIYMSCTATCGGGTKARTRSCTNPIPSFLGKNCSSLGEAVETLPCNVEPCPINGMFGEWTGFGPCSVTCGVGVQTRERKCDNPAPQYEGANCEGEAKEVKSCNEKPCPVNGNYGEWSPWSVCSVTCGSGQRTRTRECKNPEPQNGGKTCEEQGLGNAQLTEECTEHPCPAITTLSPVKNTTKSAIGSSKSAIGSTKSAIGSIAPNNTIKQ